MKLKKSLFSWLNGTKAFKGLNEKEFSWVLYDVGNSAYTLLACALIPIFFKYYAIGEGPGHISSDKATAYYSMAISIVTIVVAILGPICGALTDVEGRKRIWFSTAVALGTMLCIVNGFAHSWLFFIIVFMLTRIFYSASLVFYDSMLNDVTTEDKFDVVSSYGYAYGYIGSCLPFLLALVAYVFGPDMLGLISQELAMAIGFVITGIWWICVSLPLIKNYRQTHFVENKQRPVASAFAELGRTVKKIATYDKKVLFFLIAFFLYIDGVGTIIDNCINIGTDLHLNTVGQVITLLATQVVAFGGSLVFARLSKKYDTVKLILVCIVGYFCVCLYALTLRSLVGFAILAFGVGCFQGSIQSLSRSYFTKIIPAKHSGEYFGIYDIFSKGASFLGSAVIAWVKLAGGTINVAVACMAIFFALGFVMLRIADRIPSAEKDPFAEN